MESSTPMSISPSPDFVDDDDLSDLAGLNANEEEEEEEYDENETVVTSPDFVDNDDLSDLPDLAGLNANDEEDDEEEDADENVVTHRRDLYSLVKDWHSEYERAIVEKDLAKIKGLIAGARGQFFRPSQSHPVFVRDDILYALPEHQRARVLLLYFGFGSLMTSTLNLLCFDPPPSVSPAESFNCLDLISEVVRDTKLADVVESHDLLEDDRERVLAFVQMKHHKRMLPTDILKQVKSFVYDDERDMLYTLTRDGTLDLMVRLIARAHENLAFLSDHIIFKCLSVFFEMTKQRTRGRLLRVPLFTDTVLRIVETKGETAAPQETRRICASLFTNLTDVEESALYFLQNWPQLVSISVELLQDSRFLTIQTLTNLTNFACTREILQRDFPELLDQVIAYAPHGDVADLFRQMFISNFHVDSTFSHNIYGPHSTEKLALRSTQTLKLMLNVLSQRIAAGMDANFRLDEPLLSIMALLWNENNRRIAMRTDIIRNLSLAMSLAEDSDDHLSWTLAFRSLRHLYFFAYPPAIPETPSPEYQHHQETVRNAFFDQINWMLPALHQSRSGRQATWWSEFDFEPEQLLNDLLRLFDERSTFTLTE